MLYNAIWENFSCLSTVEFSRTAKFQVLTDQRQKRSLYVLPKSVIGMACVRANILRCDTSKIQYRFRDLYETWISLFDRRTIEQPRDCWIRQGRDWT